MVGVPRSKGCLTCRRRKVACDQTKPHCQNCTKRGVQCEGYARYPTILQYTGSGLKKRDRFEEVKTSESGSSALVPSGPSRAAQALIQPFEALAFTLPDEPSVGRIIGAQVEYSCLQSYLPEVGSISAVQELKSHWMWSVLSVSDRGQALEYSFSALCYARVGLFNADQEVLSKGRAQYALGLNALQRALQNPDEAYQDRTLAAIRTLSIYELWSMPWTSMTKAYVHEEGMAQWCVAAGPQSIRTEFALQVFHDVRWCIMNRCIDGRKSSALGTEQWKTLPWSVFPKDSLQCLFDLGFDLALLLERLDLVESPQHPEASVSKRAQLSLSCETMQNSLEDWYRLYWGYRDAPSPRFADIGEELSPASSPGTTRPEFESLWEATNVAYYWLFTMTLNEIHAATAAQEDQENLVFSSLEIAVNIVSSASYFLADATGWLGPQRLFFPLKKAMGLLMSKQSPFAEDAQKAFGHLLKKLKSGPEKRA